jgi:hypothetical protein
MTRSRTVAAGSALAREERSVPAGRPSQAWLALGLGLAFLATTTWLTWSRHDSYNNRSLDLAMYTQVVWNIANGYPYQTTLLVNNRLHLAEHFALVLLPVAPLYALVSSAGLLLLLQTSFIAASGLAVYWFARRRLGSGLALLITAAYYASPLVTDIALDDFYPITLAALPLGWATALAISGRSGSAALLALGSMLWEEEAALLAIGVGLYLLLFRTRSTRWLGVAVLLVGGTWLGVVERLIAPTFSYASSGSDANWAEGHFNELRRDPLGWLAVAAASRLEPDLLDAVGWQPSPRVDQACTYPIDGDCSVLRWWIYPTAGLALLSPGTLVMAGPPAAGLLLPDKPGRFRRHQAAPVVPLLWQATAVGLARLGRPGPRLAGGIAVGLTTLVLARLDVHEQFDPARRTPSRLGSDLTRLGDSIPPGASVVASLRGLTRLASRREVYALPVAAYRAALWPPAELPRYALIDLEQDGDQVARLENLGNRRGTPYRELRRTRVVLLLERSER